MGIVPSPPGTATVLDWLPLLRPELHPSGLQLGFLGSCLGTSYWCAPALDKRSIVPLQGTVASLLVRGVIRYWFDFSVGNSCQYALIHGNRSTDLLHGVVVFPPS